MIRIDMSIFVFPMSIFKSYVTRNDLIFLEMLLFISSGKLETKTFSSLRAKFFNEKSITL